MATFHRSCIVVVALVSCFSTDVSSSGYTGPSQRHAKPKINPPSTSGEDKESNTDKSAVELNNDNTEKRPFGRMFGGSYRIGKRRFFPEYVHNPNQENNPLNNGKMEGKMDLIDPLFENNGMTPEFPLQKRSFLSRGYSLLPGKHQYGHKANKFILDEKPLSDDFQTINKKFVMRTAYPRMLFKKNKRPLHSESSLNNKRLEVSKRPFVLGYGKRTGIAEESDSQHVGKRPFVLGGGWKMGKRPFVLGSTFGKRTQNDYMQERPFVLGNNYQLSKRPFVLGNWGMYGKRNTMKPNEEPVNKRPFVLGSGWRVGKRPSSSQFFSSDEPEVFHTNVDTDIVKRPFVLGGGYKFGKRNFLTDHVFEKSELGDEILDLNKRPFILGTGWRLGKRSYDLEDLPLTSEWPNAEK